MAKALQSLSFEHLAVGGFKDVQLLLILVVHHLVGADDLVLLLIVVGLEGWDVIDHTDRARTINPRRDAFLPDPQVIFLELVQVLEFSLKFARH